jgi:hypothetical protein
VISTTSGKAARSPAEMMRSAVFVRDGHGAVVGLGLDHETGAFIDMHDGVAGLDRQPAHHGHKGVKIHRQGSVGRRRGTQLLKKSMFLIITC